MTKEVKTNESKAFTELTKELLTVPEAAAYLSIKETTLRAYLRTGKIKAYKKFNRWYLFASEIHGFIKAPEPTNEQKAKKNKAK